MATSPEILKSSRTIAVVGLSVSPMRPSNGVATYLSAPVTASFRVNPNVAEVLGDKDYARLEEIPEKIDMVDIFRPPSTYRRSSNGDPCRRKGRLDAGGGMHETAAERGAPGWARVVMDKCTLKEHRSC